MERSGGGWLIPTIVRKPTADPACGSKGPDLQDEGLSRGAGRSAGFVVAASANGLLAYGMAVAAGRMLDDAGFASFGVAWSLWALSVAVLIFPMQHWIAWRAVVDGGLGGVVAARRRVAGLLGCLVVVLAVIGLSDELFRAPGPWWLAMASIGVSSAVLGLGRGLLVARDRIGSVAMVIGLENVFRLALVVAALALGLGAVGAGVAIGSGALALLPFAKSLRVDEAPGDQIRVVGDLLSLAGAAALAQVLVQFAPIAVELTDAGAREVAAVFSTFALTRAPVLIALALSTQVTTPIARRVETGRLTERRLGLTMLVIGCVLTPAGWILGKSVVPPIVAWFFGSGRSLPPSESAAVTAGMTLAVIGVFGIVGLLATGRARSALIVWLAATAAAISWAVWVGSVPQAFLAAEVIGFVGTVGAFIGPPRPRVDR
jgi:hypothetical protein